MVSPLLWASPHGLVFWHHGDLRIVTLLPRCLTSKRKEWKLLGQLKVPLKTGTVSIWLYSIIKRSPRVCSDSRVQSGRLCFFVGEWQNHTAKECWDGSYCNYLWKMQYATFDVSGMENNSSTLFIFQIVFSNPSSLWEWCFFSVSAISPPCFSSIKMYWVSTKGTVSLLQSHPWVQIMVSVTLCCTKKFSFNVSLLFFF